MAAGGLEGIILSGQDLLADTVTDPTLGTGKVIYVKLMDGTIDSVSKQPTTPAGRLQVSTLTTNTAGDGGPASARYWYNDSDVQSIPGVALFQFNGASFDRVRGNQEFGVIATLVTAGANGSTGDQSNYNWCGCKIGINITALTGTTPTIQVIIEGKANTSGQYYTILSSAVLNATGFTLLTIYPGLLATANLVANDHLPRIWRARYVITGTTPAVTATIEGSMLV